MISLKPVLPDLAEVCLTRIPIQRDAPCHLGKVEALSLKESLVQNFASVPANAGLK